MCKAVALDTPLEQLSSYCTVWDLQPFLDESAQEQLMTATALRLVQ